MILGRCPLSNFCSRGTPPRMKNPLSQPTLSLSTNLHRFCWDDAKSDKSGRHSTRTALVCHQTCVDGNLEHLTPVNIRGSLETSVATSTRCCLNTFCVSPPPVFNSSFGSINHRTCPRANQLGPRMFLRSIGCELEKFLRSC